MKAHAKLVGLVLMVIVIAISYAVADGPGTADNYPGAELGLSAPLIAQGFGADSIGGAGGKVIWVTNLNDSGPGSFREAVTAQGPRIVRFKVGGIINLSSPVVVKHGRLTIDGASAAPYGGITLHGYGLNLSGLECRDVIVQHLRIRRAQKEGDGIGVGNGAHRIVIDHCSVSWADDENIGINKGHYVTVQWCIIAEGLVEGQHHKGAHSCGALVAHGANHVTFHHNFWSGNVSRNALLFGVGGYGSGGAMEGCYPGEEMAVFMPLALFDFRNNLVYNFVSGTELMEGEYVNVVANYYRHGPSSDPDSAEVNLWSQICYPGSERPRVYCRGNLGPHRPRNDMDDWALVRVDGKFGSNPDYRSDKPFVVPPVRTHPARRVPNLVLREAGAHPRDEVDRRLVEEFNRGEGKAGYGYRAWKEKHGL